MIWKFGGIFASVSQLCLTFCDPMDSSTTGLPVHHQLLELTQTCVHWVGDAIQPVHPVILFSSCFQPFPESGSFQMSQFFASHGQRIGVSASASVLPMNIQSWFPLIDWFDLFAVQQTLESSPAPHFESIISSEHNLSMVQYSHPYTTTGKAIALTIRMFVSKVMSLLFNTLPRFVIAFLQGTSIF